MNTTRISSNTTESPAQKEYIRQHKRHHHFVAFMRFLVLFSFLIIWESSARLGLIDTFFFSSPSMVFLYFIKMLKDGSFFSNTGITLLETLISLVQDGNDIVLNVDGEELARAMMNGSLRLKRRFTTIEVSI